jgi:hypothetical protein
LDIRSYWKGAAMTKTAIEIQLPESEKPGVFVVGNEYVVFMRIEHDTPDCNPLEDWDGLGTIYSFCKNHRNFCRPDELPVKYAGYSVPLSYFEHGLCRWSVRGNTVPGEEFRWDGVETAGQWYPDEHVLHGMPTDDTRHEWLHKQAQHACDIYTHYCNGSVYWYQLDVYEAIQKPGGGFCKCHDTYKELGHFVTTDSCGGYYGYDHADSGLLDSVNEALLCAIGDKYEVRVKE